MKSMKYCTLNPQRICNSCGECDDRCDLDPSKVCDNCFRCLDGDGRAYAEIRITDILTEVGEDAFDPVPMQWEGARTLRIRTLPGAYGLWKRS